jgi:hypothetical protein
MGDFDKFLNRRIWDKDKGVSYFCPICGQYKPEKEFYKRKSSKWGVEPKCRLHYTKRDKNEKQEDDSHLKFSRVTEKDFVGARNLLQLLGYDTTKDVHEQFKQKHKLK